MTFIKDKTAKPPEEVGENLDDLEFSNDILDTTSKIIYERRQNESHYN